MTSHLSAARLTAYASPISPRTTSTLMASSHAASALDLTSALTCSRAATNLSIRWRPIKPVAPVTRIRIVETYPFPLDGTRHSNRLCPSLHLFWSYHREIHARHFRGTRHTGHDNHEGQKHHP